MCVYIYTYTYTHIHSTFIHKYIHACMHTSIHSFMQSFTYIHTYEHVYVRNICRYDKRDPHHALKSLDSTWLQPRREAASSATISRLGAASFRGLVLPRRPPPLGQKAPKAPPGSAGPGRPLAPASGVRPVAVGRQEEPSTTAAAVVEGLSISTSTISSSASEAAAPDTWEESDGAAR